MDSEQIPAGKFKTHCLRLLDEVNESRRTLVITKHGKPVAKIVPVMPKHLKKKKLFGCMKGSISIHGDIVSPMPEEWTTPGSLPFPD